MIPKIIGAVISLPLLLLLPGLALLRGRLYCGAGDSWAERLLFVVGTSAGISSLLALLMAEAGYLRIWLLDLVLAAVTLLAFIAFGDTRRAVFFPRPRRRELLAVAAILLVAVVMFARPAEFVAGEGDPSYYYNIGYHLAHSGEMNVHDGSVPALSDYEISTFYVNDIAQFDAFQLRDRAAGRLQPLLYHLLPAWIGIFIMLFGSFGGLWVTPLFALLGLLAIYALARRLGGPLAAGAAGLLGATFTLSVWFARIPLSETMGAFFALSSMLFFVGYPGSGNAMMAVGCALAATCAACARPEAALLFVPLLLVMLARLFVRPFRRADYAAANGLLVGAACVLAYIRFAEFNYVSGNFGKVLRVFGSHANMSVFLRASAALLLLAAVAFNFRPIGRLASSTGSAVRSRIGEDRARIADRAFKGLAALVVLAAFAYLLNMYRGVSTASAPQQMFARTSELFGGVVAVFVAGLCLAILLADELSFSFVACSLVVLLSIGVQESSLALGLYPWDSRRYMTVTVPLLLVGFGCLVSFLFRHGNAVLKVAVIGGTALVLVLFLRNDRPILRHVEYQGIDRQLSALAPKFGGDVVVMVDPYNAEVFGVPLRYQHGIDVRKVFVLRSPRGFASMVRKYNEEGRRVVIDTNDMHAPNIRLTRDINNLVSFDPAFSVGIDYPHVVPSSSAAFPREVTRQEHALSFYYVTLKGER